MNVIYIREATVKKNSTMNMKIQIILVLVLCTSWSTIGLGEPETIFQWKLLDFAYKSEKQKEDDIKSGYYVPKIPAPIDVDIDIKSERIFVTIPRKRVGSPATLGYVTKENSQITPYPTWEWNRDPQKCKANRLISVFRIKIDKCGRLWVLDSGHYAKETRCSPQLLAFNLTTNKVIHRVTFNNDLVESYSALATPSVDIRDTCDNTFIYMSDSPTFSILIHDMKNDKTWKATDSTMYPEIPCAKYTVKEDSFYLMDGVDSLTLEPYKEGKDRTLYYLSLSGSSQHSVNTSYLRNQSRFKDNPQSSPNIYKTYRTFRPSQVASQDVDRNGISYFGLIGQSSVNCWNTKSKEYGSFIKQIYQNSTTMQFVSAVKISTDESGKSYLYIVASRMQKVYTRRINPDEVNFRIHRIPMKDISNVCSNADESDPNYKAGCGACTGNFAS